MPQPGSQAIGLRSRSRTRRIGGKESAVDVAPVQARAFQRSLGQFKSMATDLSSV